MPELPGFLSNIDISPKVALPVIAVILVAGGWAAISAFQAPGSTTIRSKDQPNAPAFTPTLRSVSPVLPTTENKNTIQPSNVAKVKGIGGQMFEVYADSSHPGSCLWNTVWRRMDTDQLIKVGVPPDMAKQTPIQRSAFFDLWVQNGTQLPDTAKCVNGKPSSQPGRRSFKQDRLYERDQQNTYRNVYQRQRIPSRI